MRLFKIKIILFLALTILFCIQIGVNAQSNVIAEFSPEKDLIFRSTNYNAFVNNMSNDQHYTIVNIFDTVGVLITAIDSRKDSTLKGCVYDVSLSDSSFIVFTNFGEDCFLVTCYNLKGSFLWKREICQENSITDRTFILSLDGKYAIQTSGRSDFVLLDGKTGNEMPSKLNSLKGAYLSQFTKNNEIVIVNDSGSLIKFDISKNSFVAEIKIKSKEINPYCMKDWWANEDRTLFATRMAKNESEAGITPMLLIFDYNLNYRLVNSDGIFDRAKLSNGNILATCHPNDHQSLLLRLTKDNEKIDTVDHKNKGGIINDFTVKGDEIFYTKFGTNGHINSNKFNLKTRQKQETEFIPAFNKNSKCFFKRKLM